MSRDPGLALALDEARTAHARATQRLIHSGALARDVADELEGRNETVRALLARVRVERKRAEQNIAEARHALWKLELELQAAEKERDQLIDDRDLRGPLYFCGETFVRDRAFEADEQPLKDLAERTRALEERLDELARRAQRAEVRFTAVDAAGRERTLIRMLPALTMTGEGESV
jgi:predicted  nucleic acid-binding Zn-ribbon protein